jgi:MoaA/NifB/PqqE/SkfB family radical SAM enzyme
MIVKERDDAKYLASWMMTEACNYRCDYCEQDYTSKPKFRLDLNAITKTLDDTGKRWVVAMTGGEPFVYPRFVDLCAELSQRHRIAVDTNLSLHDRVADFAERVPAEQVSYIFASTHIEERERRNGREAFLKSATLLLDRGYNLLVNYVFHPRLRNRFSTDYEYFAARGVKLRPKPFKGTYEGKVYPDAYAEDEAELLRKYNPTADKQVPFRSRGLLCWAGRELIRIWPDGSVTRCTSELTEIGHILTGIELLEGPEPCRADRCICFGPRYLAKPLQRSESKMMLSIV